MHVKDGSVYRAFEDMDRGSASLVVAGDLSKDLLDPEAWRMSNKVEPPRHTPSLSRSASTKKDGRDSSGNWFLEGNVIEIRGELYVLLRTRIDVQLTAGMTSACKLEDDGTTMEYRFVQKAKLPYNNHDSNMITLHRVKNFRSLALDLKPDFESSASGDALTQKRNPEDP